MTSRCFMNIDGDQSLFLFTTDCLEPGTRVVSRWTNGNYYKGAVESLTNRINVLFDTGVRHSYNTRDYEDILLDRLPDPAQVAWGGQVVVNRPRSRAFQVAYIRGFQNGRYVVMYENGDKIHQALDQIRVFNSSKACGEWCCSMLSRSSLAVSTVSGITC